MPNLDPWINQNEATNKFENHLLSIKAEHQKRIRSNLHHTYSERHEKIIEMIDWTLEKYKDSLKKTHRNEVIINNISDELDKKRDVAINKKNKAMLKDEVSFYRLEEKTCDYILFIICELY